MRHGSLMPCDIAGVVSVHIPRRLYLKQKLQNRFPVVSLSSPRYFPDVVSRSSPNRIPLAPPATPGPPNWFLFVSIYDFPSVSRMCPLALSLNLKPSLLLGCEAGFIDICINAMFVAERLVLPLWHFGIATHIFGCAIWKCLCNLYCCEPGLDATTGLRQQGPIAVTWHMSSFYVERLVFFTVHWSTMTKNMFVFAGWILVSTSWISLPRFRQVNNNGSVWMFFVKIERNIFQCCNLNHCLA